MLLNIKPLTQNRDFRLLFIGQTVSFLGSMVSYVAIPMQVFQITRSSFLVGLLGAVQLIPLVLAGLYGGALADAVDRRKLLIYSEWGLTLCTFLLMGNCFLAHPSVIALFVLSALSSVLVGIHRPAMEALTPQMVSDAELPAAAALGSVRYSIGAVLGPALGGCLMSRFGTPSTYFLDAVTYLISLGALSLIRSFPLIDAQKEVNLSSIKAGFNYAISQPILVGTYLVDIIAMIFAMPIALYPAMALEWGGARAAGWLYAALPMGSAVVSLLSGSLSKVRRQGAGVILSAFVWGLFICALAFAPTLALAVACLACAGGADAVSAIYRQTMWNQMIPNNFRGRLAGLNMLSYMIGPLIGNTRAGIVASVTSNFTSILSGGILCSLGVLASIKIFPAFWAYMAPRDPEAIAS